MPFSQSIYYFEKSNYLPAEGAIVTLPAKRMAFHDENLQA